MSVDGGAHVSVVIATRDRPAPLARVIAALAAATDCPDEVVIVDQSGDDATERLVRELPAAPFGIAYVRDRRCGLGVAQNAGFARAAGAVVAVLDDDCLPGPGWLAAIAEVLDGDPALSGVTGPVLPLPDDGAGLVPVSSRTSRRRRTFVGRRVPWQVGSGNNFAFRREWLAAVGGNDERLGPGSRGRGGVDMDLFYRLLRAGARIRYEPAATVLHAMATPPERLARRVPYGYGMGAAVGIWLRERDAFAALVLARWLALRLRRALGGLARLDLRRVYEEALVLRGTAAGLAFGLRSGPRPA